MPKKKSPERPVAPTIERLIQAVEEVAGQIEVLREVIDEIRVEFLYAVRNDKMPPIHVTSMPKNSCAPDFGERCATQPPDAQRSATS